tara:strand:+ start:574 stop:753 length:180 start_codon:yes stop_codon:yes gene_type:complete
MWLLHYNKFIPKKDITTYELAQILAPIINKISYMQEYDFKFEDDNLNRHFKIIEKDKVI